MKCPNDQATLLIAERRGVEIDYCPECRGVWLDRGELDKLLEIAEREAGAGGPAATVATPPVPTDIRGEQRRDDRWRGDDDDDRRRRDDDSSHGGHKKKKRTSFLSELLEFGGE